MACATLNTATCCAAVLLLTLTAVECRPQFWFNFKDWNSRRTESDRPPLRAVKPYYEVEEPSPPSRYSERRHGPEPGPQRRPSPNRNRGPPPAEDTQPVSKILTIDQPLNTDFVFPGEASNTKTNPVHDLVPRVGIAGPACAKGSTFCEDETEYPAENIESIVLNSENSFKDLFGEDHIPINVTQRIDAFDEIPACRSREEVVFPTKGENEKNQWLYIVNIKDKFQQGVRIEQCTKEGEECRMKAGAFGYVSSCKQKYIYRKMVAIDPQGNAGPDTFKLPSCCACYFKPEAPALNFGKSIARRRRRTRK